MKSDHTFVMTSPNLELNFFEMPMCVKKYSIKSIVCNNTLIPTDIAYRLNFTIGDLSSPSTINGKICKNHVIIPFNSSGNLLTYDRYTDDDEMLSINSNIQNIGFSITRIDGSNVITPIGWQCIVVLSLWQ